MKPRVVFLDHVARLSGGEIALLRLVPALATAVDVHVILGEDGPLTERLRAAGISVEILALDTHLRDLRKDSIRPGALDARSLATMPSYIWRLRRRLRALDADLVHTNTLKAALYGGLAARLAGVPAIWHVRDRIADDYLPTSAIRLVRIASRLLPVAVVANSQATLETLPRSLHGAVLYNPVVPDSVEGPLVQRGQRGDEVTIGMPGRLAPWKGQTIFLEAFARAFRGEPVRARVIGAAMFGEEAYAAGLHRQAEELGIAAQVEFRGFREDIWSELAELDILVHCSLTPEPFGQVVLEGMAAGLPVVAANAGGPAELITDTLDGLLTTPGDAGELAIALRRLVDDPALRAHLAAGGRVTSLQFTPARTAQQLLKVYEGVLGRSLTGPST